jgi:anti-sigma factor RsiW
MTIPMPPGPHLEVEQVVAYLENRLPAPERRRVQAHLADCAECASELVEVSRLRRPPRPMMRWLGPAAVAAAVVAVALVGPWHLRQATGPTVPPVRGGGGVTVDAVAPAEGAVVSGAPKFTWRSMPGATSYRITVSRADGDSVWTATVTDTTARAPTTSAFDGSTSYYWYVDVLLADGRSIAGTAHEFRVRP